ncbi:MAG: YfhO family protein, partial [Candidatus Latescibacterota bacterium]
GRHSPGYDLASHLLPPLQMLRYPEKAFIVTAFAWALLAGAGFDTWRDPPKGRCWRLGIGSAASVGSLVLLLGVWQGIDPEWALRWLDTGASAEHLALPLRALAASAAVSLMVTGAAILTKREGRAGRIAVCVAGIAALDLLVQNRHVNPTAFRQLLTYQPPFVGALRQPGRPRVYAVDYDTAVGKAERLLGRPAPYRPVRGFRDWPLPVSETLAMRTCLVPHVASAWGVETSYDLDARGLYPAPLARLAALAHDLEGTPAHLRLLRMGAVSRLVTLHARGLEELPLLGTFPGFLPEPIRLFRVPDPLPRTYVVGGVRVADGEKAIEVLLDPAFDPWREVVLPEGSAVQADPSFSGESRLIELRPDRVRIEAVLSQPGYVVLVDGYDPGWRVKVDGQPAELLRANLVFRAVPIPTGRHLVEQVYRPRSITLGLMVSATALLTGLAVLVRGQRPPAPGSSSA